MTLRTIFLQLKKEKWRGKMFKLFKHKLIKFTEILIATVGYIIALLSFLSVFYINKLIADYAKGIAEITNIQFYLIVVFLIFLQLGLVFYFANYYFQKSTLNIGGRIFNSIFNKILKLSPSDYDKYDKSSILNIIFSDTFSTANMTLAAISGVSGNTIFVILAVYILYNVNTELLIVSLIMLPIYFITSVVSSMIIKRKNKILLEKNDSMISVIKNCSENIPIIKMLDKKENIKEGYKLHVNGFYVADKKKFFYENLFSSIYSIFGVITQIIILFLGSNYVSKGLMTIGDLIMYSGICGFLFEPISNISKILQTIKSGKPNFDRVNIILSHSSKNIYDYKKSFRDMDYGIEALGIVKDNLGNNLYDIDIKLPSTGFYILQGPNGSGKSTIFNIISGIYDINQLDGSIYINDEFKDNISILNYPLFLIDDTVGENISLGNLKENPLYEMQIDKKVTSNPPNVSSGEAQKIVLNRVLNLDRKLVLIDEPSTNLETQAISLLKEYIEKEKNNKLIVVITHDENYNELADGIMEIKDKSVYYR